MTRLPDRELLSHLAAYDPHVSNLTLAVREMVLEEEPDAIESISKGYAVHDWILVPPANRLRTAFATS